MKKFNEQLDNLEEDLDELLIKSEKILGYKSENLNDIVEDLLSHNTEESTILANDIMDIEEDMIIMEEFFDDTPIEDDPFNTLYDQDEDLNI